MDGRCELRASIKADREGQQQISDRNVQFSSFLDEHGHFPQRRSTDVEEKRLPDWAYRHMRTLKPWSKAAELIEGAGSYRQIGQAELSRCAQN